MNNFSITATKDEARVLGLVLAKGQRIAIDVELERLSELQSAVDSGDVKIQGLNPTPAKADKK